MAENSRFGREPIQVVQIDQDFCSRRYGDLPCTASSSANLIDWSENSDLASTLFGKPERVGVEVGPDGFLYQEFEIVQSNGISGLRYARSNYKVNESGKASWRVKIKKTSYPSEITVSVESSTRELGGLDQYGENSIIIDGQTGTETSTLDFGSYFNAEYVIEQDGDYYEVSVVLEPKSIDPNIEQTTFSELVRIEVDETLYLNETWLVGKMRNGPAENTSDYVKTEGQVRLPTGNNPCFNTRSTCQDPENYDRGVLPLKFVDKRSPIPKDDYYIPSLTGVSVTPAKLNPGGANRNASALGERATVNLTFMDHPHNDRMVDKYRTERDYDPSERGTFWTKWRARNPYYMQRPITLRSGYLKDGNIVDEVTRAFVITGFSGPDNQGRVQIKGKDVLTLAEDSKAQAPNVSTGRLNADISAGANSLTLTPAGIGNEEYSASGFIRINKEVIGFTRSGDTMSLSRAQFGTEADSHDEDDTVQQCLRYQSEAPQDILYDLLKNYAGIPDAYLDKAGWDAEALDYLPRLYSAIISEPEGVSKLISEMCQQMYFTIWFDERESLVKLRAVRLAEDDEVYELDDNMHLIENSISWKDLSDELITQVWVYYGQSNPTEKLDQGDNYVAVSVTVDPLAEGPNKHNLRRIKKVFSRWIDAANAGAAEDLGRRILNRYGNAPREVSFKVDAKDNYLWLGDFVRLTNRLRVDRFGLPAPVNIQLFQAQESSLGSEFQFTGQEFIPALTDGDEVEDPSVRTIPITSDFLNVNLRTLHDSQFGAPTGNETITFVIRGGVTIGGDAAGGGVNVPYAQRDESNDTYSSGSSVVSGVNVGTLPILQRASISSPRTISAGATYDSLGAADYIIKEYPASLACRTGSWPSGVVLNLVIEAGAYLIGEGGNGSAHAMQETPGVTDGNDIRRCAPGGDGGDALLVEHAISITNGGVIGGGGGGGAGTPGIKEPSFPAVKIVPGGGGAGFELSDTSQIKSAGTEWDGPAYTSTQPAVGTRVRSGTGGYYGLGNPTEERRFRGGRGGSLGFPGSDSSYFYRQSGLGFDTSFSVVPGEGGEAGKAIRSGANLIAWLNKGDVRGQEVN